MLWVIGWAKNISLFQDEIRLKVRFDNVAGLSDGDQVSVNGVKRGFVESIENEGNDVLVTLNFNGDLELREDAGFSIMMLDLMGGKKVEVSPGSSQNKIDFSKIQTGKFKGDISTAMAALSSVQTDLIDAVKELRITLSGINNLVGDKEFRDQLRMGLSNFTKAAGALNLLIENNKNSITSLIENSSQLTKTADKAIHSGMRSLDSLIMESRETLSDSRGLIKSISDLLGETTAGKNNAGKLLYDEKLMNNLKSSIERLNKLTKLLIEQLREDGINVDANIDLF
jgi:phospholipid/cholesterol/gamma-HCH transport system substrate-binding protein